MFNKEIKLKLLEKNETLRLTSIVEYVSTPFFYTDKITLFYSHTENTTLLHTTLSNW